MWGKAGILPEIFVAKCRRLALSGRNYIGSMCPQIHSHRKIFFIQLKSVYTVECVVRSEGIARGSKG